MKNNYHQSFVVACLMTYIQLNSHYVFIIYLDYILLILLTLWPLFMDEVQLPQGYSHFEHVKKRNR